MSEKWLEAAERYSKTENSKQKEEIQRTVLEIESFLRQYGDDALKLLKASRRHIIFGESEPERGMGVVYLLNGDGLQQSVEAMGTGAAYAKPEEKPQPVLSPITAEQAAYAAVVYGRKRPGIIVEWLVLELERIADAAPR